MSQRQTTQVWLCRRMVALAGIDSSITVGGPFVMVTTTPQPSGSNAPVANERTISAVTTPTNHGEPRRYRLAVPLVLVLVVFTLAVVLALVPPVLAGNRWACAALGAYFTALSRNIRAIGDLVRSMLGGER